MTECHSTAARAAFPNRPKAGQCAYTSSIEFINLITAVSQIQRSTRQASSFSLALHKPSFTSFTSTSQILNMLLDLLDLRSLWLSFDRFAYYLHKSFTNFANRLRSSFYCKTYVCFGSCLLPCLFIKPLSIS